MNSIKLGAGRMQAGRGGRGELKRHRGERGGNRDNGRHKSYSIYLDKYRGSWHESLDDLQLGHSVFIVVSSFRGLYTLPMSTRDISRVKNSPGTFEHEK